MTVGPATASDAPAPTAPPVRLGRISLTDFRAFPGPAPTRFDLDGKNLLVYGENGAGKSSLFLALKDFFSLEPSRTLSDYKNVFTTVREADCRVAMEFVGDNTAVEWTPSRHPCVLNFKKPVGDWNTYFNSDADSRVIGAARRSACLDYKSLLETHYKHGQGEINLFEVAVKHLLHDFPVTVAGGQELPLGGLWLNVLKALPSKHTQAAVAKINQACVDFNQALRKALDGLLPEVNRLLQALGWQDVELKTLQAPGVSYLAARLKRDRVIKGQVLTAELTFRSKPLPRPQIFLNEARLSALALALYLGGRLACTPTAGSVALKLLVLDDVLVGLDHSNRLPVLRVLEELFADWQVVLLTHDRGWFDLARRRVSGTAWICYEVYEGDSAAAAPMPVVRKTQNRPAPALLQKARDLLVSGYMEAAANYVRQAFEIGIRAACEFKGIKLSYKQDVTAHKAQDMLAGLKQWPGSATVPKADWDAALHRLQVMKDVVMNPYSHPSAPNIPKQEILDAVDAVEKFLELAKKQ